MNLVSKASARIYPENKLSSFRTLIPLTEGLVLPPGHWEVAITELSYPSQLQNVTDGTFQCATKHFDAERDFLLFDVPQTLRIETGHYTSVEMILDAMNAALRLSYPSPISNEEGDIIEMQAHVNPQTKILTITSVKPMRIQFGPHIAPLLGFYSHTYYDLHGTLRADFPIDLQRIHVMYIYTDIIEHQIVGDVMAPSLRTVPLVSYISPKNGQHMCKTTTTVKRFDHLEFKRVVQSTIGSILMELRDEYGYLIAFPDMGTVCATLIFRKAGAVLH